MGNSDNIFIELKSQLKACAFKVSNGADRNEIHDLLIEAIVKLNKLESLTPIPGNTKKSLAPLSDATEVNKVARRLKLWANRQDQMNSRILVAYLDLKRNGHAEITESQLRDGVNDPAFSSNFNQMKIIADRNHGKIFDQNGEIITIWPPIETIVNEFERAVFS